MLCFVYVGSGKTGIRGWSHEETYSARTCPELLLYILRSIKRSWNLYGLDFDNLMFQCSEGDIQESDVRDGFSYKLVLETPAVPYDWRRGLPFEDDDEIGSLRLELYSGDIPDKRRLLRFLKIAELIC